MAYIVTRTNHDGHDEGGHHHGVTLSADPTLRARQRRVLWWVLAANGGFMVVEVVAGLAFGSLALLPMPRTWDLT